MLLLPQSVCVFLFEMINSTKHISVLYIFEILSLVTRETKFRKLFSSDNLNQKSNGFCYVDKNYVSKHFDYLML